MVWILSDPSHHRLHTVYFLVPILIIVGRQQCNFWAAMHKQYYHHAFKTSSHFIRVGYSPDFELSSVAK